MRVTSQLHYARMETPADRATGSRPSGLSCKVQGACALPGFDSCQPGACTTEGAGHSWAVLFVRQQSLHMGSVEFEACQRREGDLKVRTPGFKAGEAAVGSAWAGDGQDRKRPTAARGLTSNLWALINCEGWRQRLVGISAQVLLDGPACRWLESGIQTRRRYTSVARGI